MLKYQSPQSNSYIVFTVSTKIQKSPTYTIGDFIFD